VSTRADCCPATQLHCNAQHAVSQPPAWSCCGAPFSLPCLQGASLTALYCDFSRNKAALGAGLTVRDPDTSAEVLYSTFWDNSADGNGGAVSVTSGSLYLENVTFTSNDAMYGGAIAIDSSASLQLGES